MGMDEEARLTQGFGRMQAVMRARKPIITSWRRRPLTKAEIAIFDQVTGLTPKDRLSMYLRMPSQMNVSKFNQVLQVIRDHFYGEVTRGYGESEALELLADHHYAAWEAAWPVVVSGQSKTPFRQVGALAAITYLDAHYRALGDPFSSQKVVQTWIDMSANLGLLPHTPAHTMHGRITGSYSRKTSRAFHLNLMRRLLHGFSALFAHRNLRRLTPQGTILDPTLRTKVIEADL